MCVLIVLFCEIWEFVCFFLVRGVLDRLGMSRVVVNVEPVLLPFQLTDLKTLLICFYCLFCFSYLV